MPTNRLSVVGWSLYDECEDLKAPSSHSGLRRLSPGCLGMEKLTVFWPVAGSSRINPVFKVPTVCFPNKQTD